MPSRKKNTTISESGHQKATVVYNDVWKQLAKWNPVFYEFWTLLFRHSSFYSDFWNPLFKDNMSQYDFWTLLSRCNLYDAFWIQLSTGNTLFTNLCNPSTETTILVCRDFRHQLHRQKSETNTDMTMISKPCYPETAAFVVICKSSYHETPVWTMILDHRYPEATFCTRISEACYPEATLSMITSETSYQKTTDFYNDSCISLSRSSCF